MLQIALNDDQGYSNKIALSHKGLRRFTRVVPKVISITHAFSAERSRVERFIEAKFAASYQAKLTQHYPVLMSIRDNDDTILAALGFRPAHHDALFLEHYLDHPIEQSLEEQIKHRVRRENIVEVGSLAASAKGASIFLFIALNAWLEKQGYKMVAVTATRRLQLFFSLLGLDFVKLGIADPNRLPDAGKQWGSYYQKKPRILAGSISQTQSRMYDMLKFHLMDNPLPMYARLHQSIEIFPDE